MLTAAPVIHAMERGPIEVLCPEEVTAAERGPGPNRARGLRRLPVSDHTRFIQDTRAVFPGARVLHHEWRGQGSGGGADV